jgi:hypothetical protein
MRSSSSHRRNKDRCSYCQAKEASAEVNLIVTLLRQSYVHEPKAFKPGREIARIDIVLNVDAQMVVFPATSAGANIPYLRG